MNLKKLVSKILINRKKYLILIKKFQLVKLIMEPRSINLNNSSSNLLNHWKIMINSKITIYLTNGKLLKMEVLSALMKPS